MQGTPEASGIYLTSLDGGEPKFLTAALSATFVPPDLIFFERQATLLVQRLDVKRQEMTGQPTTVSAPVGSDTLASGHAGFSVSADGRIAYRGISAALHQLTWYDRSGKAMGAVGELLAYFFQLARHGQSKTLGIRDL